MEARQLAVLLEQADRRRRAHDWDGATDLLKRALAIDPEHARAHAALALALLGARRLHGARIEAELALAFDGNDRFCHYAAAIVLRARRKLDEAWAHCLVALQEEGAGPDYHVLAASIRVLQGDRVAARELLDEALAIEPEHSGALTALAQLELREGHLAEAQRWIEAALAADPADHDAHVVAGHVALRRGDAAEAEQHARFALAGDATDHGALELWTAIQARRSLWLGLWWRVNAFMAMRSERGQLALLLGSFMLVRIAMIVAGGTGHEDLEALLGKLWLAFCAYTWVAPPLFRRMLRRQLATVVLRDDF